MEDTQKPDDAVDVPQPDKRIMQLMHDLKAQQELTVDKALEEAGTGDSSAEVEKMDAKAVTQISIFLKNSQVLEVKTELTYEELRKKMNNASRDARFVTLKAGDAETHVNLDEIIMWTGAKIQSSRIITGGVGSKIVKPR